MYWQKSFAGETLFCVIRRMPVVWGLTFLVKEVALFNDFDIININDFVGFAGFGLASLYCE